VGKIVEHFSLSRRKQLFATSLIVAVALITVLGDSAEARRKRPAAATGECRCRCTANQNPQNFSTSISTTTSDGCGGVVGSACVANSGTSNAALGKWSHCDWTNTSGGAAVPSGALEPPGGSPSPKYPTAPPPAGVLQGDTGFGPQGPAPTGGSRGTRGGGAPSGGTGTLY
jgi:hypothetical protein